MNKKLLMLSFLISIAIHTSVLIPFFTVTYVHAQVDSTTTNKSDVHPIDHCEDCEYDPSEHDEPHEKAIDTFFHYLKKAVKFITGAAIAAGTAFQIFKTFWK